jgi:hypothetical protein
MRDSINATFIATPDDLEQWLKSYRLSKYPDDEPGIWSTHGRISYHSPEHGTLTFEIKASNPGELSIISVNYEKNDQSQICVDNLVNAILNRFGELSLPNNLSKLRDQFVEYFNKSELKDLCLDLSIEYENLEGETLNDQARELIKHCYRHGKSEALIRICQGLRPRVNWEVRDK